MKQELAKFVEDAEAIAGDIQKTFGNFSAEQINWKPSADGWSVGQCFEHLIKTNSLFFPELEKIAGGERKNSFLYTLCRCRYPSDRKQLDGDSVSSIVFSRPDGHISDRVAIAGHGLDALLVVTDHDLGFYIHILQLKVL